MAVHFAHGKGVKMRGPYTVGSNLGPPGGAWRTIVQAYLTQRWQQGARPSDLLFPATQEFSLPRRTSHLLAAIRVADPALSMRAMRRGSLQAVMAAGFAIDDVMMRAGHTSTKTTRRYLDFGRKDEEALARGARITAPLLH
jgi:integrase